MIEKLGLIPLQGEGGYYIETYRSKETVPASHLPEGYDSERAFSTAIYYLLTPDNISTMHAIPTEEIYHFYLGDPVTMLLLFPDGKSEVITLGQDILNGHLLQFTVPGNTWMGSFLNEGGSYALMGTTVSPGFDFRDYQSADKNDLLAKYPNRRGLIEKLCPETDSEPARRNQTEYQIRSANRADLDKVISLAAETSSLSSSPYRKIDGREVREYRRADLESLHQSFHNPSLAIYIAESKDGEFLGHVIVMSDCVESSTGETQGYIFDISVIEKYRSLGVGGNLMKVAEEFCEKSGMKYLCLNVTSSNEQAVGFYEKIGYKEERKRMIKVLGKNDNY